jgi:hypothetical protein
MNELLKHIPFISRGLTVFAPSSTHLPQQEGNSTTQLCFSLINSSHNPYLSKFLVVKMKNCYTKFIEQKISSPNPPVKTTVQLLNEILVKQHLGWNDKMDHECLNTYHFDLMYAIPFDVMYKCSV